MDARVSEVVAAALEETDAAEPKALATSDSAAGVSGPCQSDSEVHGPRTVAASDFTHTHTLSLLCGLMQVPTTANSTTGHLRPQKPTSSAYPLPSIAWPDQP